MGRLGVLGGQATESDRSKAFPSIAHSMQALPGIGDLSDYGIKVEDLSDEPNEELEAIRERREREWALAENRVPYDFAGT